MVRWHHQHNEHEFEQTLGDSEGHPGGLKSMGLQRVGHNLVTEQQQQRYSNKDIVLLAERQTYRSLEPKRESSILTQLW